MHKLTVVVVTFNSRAVITNCLEQLVDDPGLRIVVVDNNSDDGTPAVIKAHYPSVEVIAQKQNMGYGRAANVVLRHSDTPYALLLNPDLTANPADIRKLWAYAEIDASNTAIWGPATLRKDFTGEPPEQVKWISGSAMLFDVAKIRQVGLFDENIFLFSEETDLCERTLRSGYTIKFCRDIYFDHLIGQGTASSSKIEYLKWWHFGWSQCYRMVKNGHVTYVRNPTIKHIVYRIHSVTSLTRAKRMKWRAKADGALAYIRGVKAFRADGTPQMS